MAKKKAPTFWIQVEEVSGPVRPQASTDQFIAGTKKTLNQVSEMIEESCSAFIAKIDNLPAKRPSEISIEFGVDATAEAGVILTKGSIGANFKVSLKWAWE